MHVGRLLIQNINTMGVFDEYVYTLFSWGHQVLYERPETIRVMSRRANLRQDPREEFPCQRTMWFMHALHGMESLLIQTWLTTDGARFLRARPLL
jgi:hypothetical protein